MTLYVCPPERERRVLHEDILKSKTDDRFPQLLESVFLSPWLCLLICPYETLLISLFWEVARSSLLVSSLKTRIKVIIRLFASENGPHRLLFA